MLNLIPHAVLHAPVSANLEAGSPLGAEFRGIGHGIVLGDLSAGRVLGLLVEREVEDRLRDGLQVVELLFGVAVTLEEEKALLADTTRDGARSVS